jgi:hypothetical protein
LLLSDTTQPLDKLCSHRTTRAAMFDVSDTQRSEWNRHLHYLPTEARKKHRSAANRRQNRTGTLEVMRYIMLSLMSISFCGGCLHHTLADVMHLEEGIVICFRFSCLCLTLSWEP